MTVADVEQKQRITAPSPVPGKPAIDRAHLAQMTLGDKNLEAEVLRLFERQSGLLLGRMDGAPPAAVAAFAHTLKGSARGVGVWQVAAAAEAVELVAAGFQAGELAAAIEALAAAIAATRAAIEDLLATS